MPDEQKVNRNAGGYETGNGLNTKKGVYLCQCGRGMFSKQEICVSVGNHTIFTMKNCFRLNCMKCSGSWVCLIRKGEKGCVSAFASSTEAEKLIEEARQDEWDTRFLKAEAEAIQ